MVGLGMQRKEALKGITVYAGELMGKTSEFCRKATKRT